jgi:hypothetical protein
MQVVSLHKSVTSNFVFSFGIAILACVIVTKCCVIIIIIINIKTS